MLDKVYDYAGDYIFQIHPVKSKAIKKTVGNRKIDSVTEHHNELKLGYSTMRTDQLVSSSELLAFSTCTNCHPLLK